MGDYLWYLQNFDLFHEIPLNLKEKDCKKYKRYLKNLFEYLKDFFKRVMPLVDYSVVDQQFKEDFEFKWKEGTIRGWEQKDNENRSKELYC